MEIGGRLPVSVLDWMELYLSLYFVANFKVSFNEDKNLKTRVTLT